MQYKFQQFIWLAAIVPVVASAQGVDFMESFNAANQAAIDQARTTNLNSAQGVHGERSGWPDIDEANLERHEFTLAELKAMAMSDRQRARAMLEGRTITVRGQAGKPNRHGTWMFVNDPQAKFSARGEWSSPINQPSEGTPLALRGQVTRFGASSIHMQAPQILR